MNGFGHAKFLSQRVCALSSLVGKRDFKKLQGFQSITLTSVVLGLASDGQDLHYEFPFGAIA
jgi:hypothetical protein